MSQDKLQGYRWYPVLSPQPVSSPTFDLESVLRDAALASEHFSGKFATVLRGHHPLQGLKQGRGNAVIIRELLGTVMHPDACEPAKKFIMRTLVDVLESAPTTDIEDNRLF
jgi:hypothetical protein